MAWSAPSSRQYARFSSLPTVVMTVALAFYYGLSRSIDRGTAYVPARIEGSTPRPVEPAR